MTINVSPTPNPLAQKFEVVTGVSENITLVPDQSTDMVLAQELFALAGVVRLFFTPGFLTISTDPSGDWDVLAPQILEVLERHFPEQ